MTMRISDDSGQLIGAKKYLETGQEFIRHSSLWHHHASGRHYQPHRITCMLFTLAVLLLVLWFLGLITSYTLGGFIHLLLILAVVAVLVRLISGRRSSLLVR